MEYMKRLKIEIGVGRDCCGPRENHESERLCLFEAPISSDSVEKMEAELMNILHQVKQAGGSASLTFTTTGGKFKAKLEVQLGAPSSTSSGLSPSLHYGKVSMGGATFRFLNFASHFIRVQIFQIDFPLIISASKYFRQISLSFYICRGQNEQPAISISQ